MSLEQTALSDFIKSVHQDLRNDSKKLGADQAWKKHCDSEECLQKYAETMHNLAREFWEKHHSEASKVMSRITWTYNSCQEYYFSGGLRKQREKELAIASKINLNVNTINTSEVNPLQKLRLLDVGSCYNPFKIYNCFDVTAVDIAPATDDVIKCDFLNLTIVDKHTGVSYNLIHMNQMLEEYFDVVVFSLLLEYLPSPSQRQTCCENAYKLLKTEGILIIITPDSKHVGANAKFMKSWRYVLAKLGFSRIKYEKLLHIHCMVFRKSLDVGVPERWADLHHNDQFFNQLYIPQDFKDEESHSEVAKPSTDLSEIYININEELPFCNDEQMENV